MQKAVKVLCSSIMLLWNVRRCRVTWAQRFDVQQTATLFRVGWCVRAWAACVWRCAFDNKIIWPSCTAKQILLFFFTVLEAFSSNSDCEGNHGACQWDCLHNYFILPFTIYFKTNALIISCYLKATCGIKVFGLHPRPMWGFTACAVLFFLLVKWFG